MSTKSLPESLLANDRGLVFACRLDGQGGGKLQGWDEIADWSQSDDHIWVHLDRTDENTGRWLRDNAGVDEVTVQALLEEETRPRIIPVETGLAAILRGVNLNPGADPDDMVALRIFVSNNRLITVRNRPLLTPRDLLSELLDKKSGPKSVPALFVRLAERLTERMNSVVVNLDEMLDDIEVTLNEKMAPELRQKLNQVRHMSVGLRRYIGPQRDALSRIQIEHPDWLTAALSNQLRETSDKLQRYVEDLDAARDRAVVIRDEISNRMADAMNERMYALSVIAGIFLPLSFLTGLLGINVGGMPGVEYGWAFWITCVLLVVVLVGEYFIFRRLKWI